jgi:uncharacterized membrane protein
LVSSKIRYVIFGIGVLLLLVGFVSGQIAQLVLSSTEFAVRGTGIGVFAFVLGAILVLLAAGMGLGLGLKSN